MNRELLQRALDALENVCLDSDRASKEDTLLHTSAIAELRAALAAGGSVSPVEPVHQWRKRGTAQWWDGYADYEDGGGPYEARTLYTHAIPSDVQLDADRYRWLRRVGGRSWHRVDILGSVLATCDAYDAAIDAAMAAPKVTP